MAGTPHLGGRTASLRPAGLAYSTLRRIDRVGHTTLPLDDHRGGINAPALRRKANVSWEEGVGRRAVTEVERSQGVAHFRWVSRSGLLNGLLDDPNFGIAGD